MTAPPSVERAHYQALVSYLASKTLFDWEYYDNLHTPTDPVVGGVLVLGIYPEGKIIPGMECRYRMAVQLRVMIGGTTETAVQGDLLDYTRYIDNFLRELATTGITGTYATLPIKKALMGIRMGESGVFYAIDRSADNTGDVAITGRAFLEYEFNLEV